MSSLEKLKIILREDDIPYFSDMQLSFYLEENNGDVNATAYQCLLIKAEDTSISLSGYTSTSTAEYFKRLSRRYKPVNSGILGG